MGGITLIVKDPDGTVLALGLENEKGFNKSIENSILWCLHPETGKLIPFEEFGFKGTFIGITKGDSWYEAVVDPVSKTVTKENRGQGDIPAAENKASRTSSMILERLAGIIRDRRKNMPEGSYTTHLFNSGEEKIRKKTGEEAVELILAKSDDEIVYEAADLIYHMLVLLEEKRIPLAEILAELERRAK